VKRDACAAALDGVLILGTGRIWHLLLTRLYVGNGEPVAFWLVCLFLVVVARRWVTGQNAAATTWRDRLWMRLDGASVVLVAFLLILVGLFDVGFERAASDGREYFVQVRSLVIDGDLDYANENAVFGVRGTAWLCPFGSALLWAPFYALCHGWLWVENLVGARFTLDGYINPYQRAVGLSSLLYGWLGLVLVYRVLSDYFDKALAAGVTIALCFGAFFVWYVTVENTMVHANSWFTTTMFLYLWHRDRMPQTVRRWAALGVAAGLMTMVRWQNATFVLGPAIYWGVCVWRDVRASRRLDVARYAAHAAAFVVAGCVTFAPQLLFWRIVLGGWFAVPSESHALDWTFPHVTDVLFSPYHGLFSWTPIVYLAVLGFPAFVRRDRALSGVLALGFLTQVLVNASVDHWWGGTAFGARRFDNNVLFFGVGLASLITWLRARPLVTPVAVLVTLIGGNAAFALAARARVFPIKDGITFPAIMEIVYARTGNPFSFPMNAWVSWKYDADPTTYDRLRGKTYNNLAITMGSPDDRQFLGRGWLDSEQGPGYSFRWTSGLSASMVVPLKSDAPYRIDLQCAPFTYPGAPPQTLDVVINGTSVTRLTLAPSLTRYDVDVPGQVLRPGLNAVRLEFAYAISPKDAGVSEDWRRLAVMVTSVRLTRDDGNH
jgi:hypothetical protein